MKVLCVIDMQKDFINGSLGSKEAQAIVENVVNKIKNFDGLVIATQDTHYNSDYSSTLEGIKLPVVHCIKNTEGWMIEPSVKKALDEKSCEFITKYTFGSSVLGLQLRSLPNIDSVEICGLCTDICVVSNALMLREALPNTPISVSANCCAGSTPEKHEAALKVMQSCQIDVI